MYSKKRARAARRVSERSKVTRGYRSVRAKLSHSARHAGRPRCAAPRTQLLFILFPTFVWKLATHRSARSLKKELATI